MRRALREPRSASRGIAPAVAVWLLPLTAFCATACTHAGQCNPYYPAVRGATWTYQDAARAAGAMQRVVAVESVEESGRVTTAVLRQQVRATGEPTRSAGAAITTIRCAGGAVQIAVDGTAAGMAGPGRATASIKAELPGFPPPDQLVAGYHWQSAGRVETTDGTSSAVTTIARESQVDGLVPVKVPAGDFPQALQVTSTETLKTPSPTGEREARQQVREWYVRGIGLVKRDVHLDGEPQKTASAEELAGYTGLKPEQ